MSAFVLVLSTIWLLVHQLLEVLIISDNGIMHNANCNQWQPNWAERCQTPSASISWMLFQRRIHDRKFSFFFLCNLPIFTQSPSPWKLVIFFNLGSSFFEFHSFYYVIRASFILWCSTNLSFRSTTAIQGCRVHPRHQRFSNLVALPTPP